MTLIQKIQLLVKIRKPASEIAGQLKEAKRGYKKISFWVTIVGSALSIAAAAKALIPATAALVTITLLTAAYNVLRGLDKADTDTSRGTLVTTEFWLALLGEFSKVIIALQAGGINPAWMATLSSVTAAAMAAAQQLANEPKHEKA